MHHIHGSPTTNGGSNDQGKLITNGEQCRYHQRSPQQCSKPSPAQSPRRFKKGKRVTLVNFGTLRFQSARPGWDNPRTGEAQKFLPPAFRSSQPARRTKAAVRSRQTPGQPHGTRRDCVARSQRKACLATAFP